MDEYRVVSLFGAGSCQFDANPDTSRAIRSLRGKVRLLHLRHFAGTALRALAAAGLVYAGQTVGGAPWDYLASVAGILFGVYAALYGIRGHASISSYYRARRYWLQAPGIDQDLSPVFLQHSRREGARRAG